MSSNPASPLLAPLLMARPRSAREIADVLSRLLAGEGFAEPAADPLLDALVRVGARYGEILTACINAAPEHQLQAMADMLGTRPRPPVAARAILTFKAAAGSSGSRLAPVVVPARTRLAAPPGPGDTEPVVFETLADLTLVRAELARALAVDGGHRSVTDVGAMLLPAGLGAVPASSGQALAQALYIAPRFAGLPGLKQVVVRVEVADAGLPNRKVQLEWGVRTPDGDQALVVESDTTSGLIRSGVVTLTAPADWPESAVDGTTARWLTVHPRWPAAGAVAARAAWRSPRLRAIAVELIASLPAQPAVAASNDGVPLDTSKDFFPLGERPRFGSLFQLRSPAFDEAGAKVEVAVQMTNPVGADASPIPVVSREGQPVVAWELSTQTGFVAIAVKDGTASLTQSGSLLFTVPAGVAPVDLAGVKGVWLRARLASGHYGTVAVKDPVPMTLQRAPSIHTLSVQSSVQRGPVAPEHLALQGGLSVVRVDPASAAPFDVFLAPDVEGPALYLALAAAPGVLAAGRVLSLHVRVAVSEGPACVADAVPTADAETRPRWQARGADGWVDLDASGDAADLSRSGLVLLTLPADIQPWLGSVADATAAHRWLRIVWPKAVSDDSAANLLPRGLALNGVPAAQLQRLRGEVVGSSNGRGGQAFTALRTPIVGPVWLQVREADDHWVTWQEVEDLSNSTATSRDFTLDRSDGDIRFGDGRHGRIPPAGPNNLRLHDYATGGGSRGNRPAGSITQLRSAVPSVESVVNVEAARGGLNTESPAELRDQAFGWLRHRDRAICADDFEALARKASPEVARAFCVAGRDLSGRVDPDSDARRAADNTVSLVVVPHGSDERPQPTTDLLKSVKDYLDPRRSPAARLVVVGPHYARASVTAEVSVLPSQSAFEVEQACRQAIAGFLHPVTGGTAGEGWALGQRPHRSDIHGLLGSVDGVALVRASSLSLAAPSDMPFVVSAGNIDVRVQG